MLKSVIGYFWEICNWLKLLICVCLCVCVYCVIVDDVGGCMVVGGVGFVGGMVDVLGVGVIVGVFVVLLGVVLVGMFGVVSWLCYSSLICVLFGLFCMSCVGS